MDIGQEIVNFYWGIHLQLVGHPSLIYFHCTVERYSCRLPIYLDIWTIVFYSASPWFFTGQLPRLPL